MGSPLNTLDMIKNREKELKPLYDRMDEDERRILSDDNPYRMTYLNDPTKVVDGVVNVTMNYASTTIDDLATLILNATMQTVIEGFKNKRELNAKEKKVVESYLDLNYEIADDFLTRRGEQKLMSWVARHICERGWIVSRYKAFIDTDGTYIPDLENWDARYAAHEYGGRDLSWASYRSWRSGLDIRKDYPEAPVSEDAKNIEVVTFFDDTVQEVWIDGIEIDPQTRQMTGKKAYPEDRKHNFGYVPVVIQACPTGPMYRGRDYIKHEGESAIWLDRMLFEELNRVVSIEQTMGMLAIKAGYTIEKQLGDPKIEYPNIPGQVQPIPVGRKLELVEQPDFNVGARQGRADILDALKQGGRNIDVGNITQSFSAVAIAAIEELRRKALIPRLDGVSMYKQQLSAKMIKQHLFLLGKKKFNGELSLPGKSRTFSKEDLNGDYSIRYKMMSKSKEVEIANLAIANAAVSIGIPKKVWVRDILMAQNPEEILAQMDNEKAEAADPVIAMIRMAHSMIDEAVELSEETKEAKLIEAYMLGKQAVMILTQRQNPLMQQEAQPIEKPKGNANMLIPLMGNKGLGGAKEETEVK